MKSFLEAISKIRMRLWWHHIVAPLLGVVYVLLLLGNFSVLDLLPVFFCLLLSILGTASLGYWINDWADQKQDLAVGKKNAAAEYSIFQKILVLLVLLLIALAPWYFLPHSFLSFGLWILLVWALVLYSVPPFRLKEKTFWGVLCDMSYGHLLPVWIIVGTFQHSIQAEVKAPGMISLLLCLVLVFKGCRNIIQHQLEDRKKDQLLRLNTFVHWLGPYPSALLISRAIVPLEVISLAILLWFVHIGLFLFYVFFLLTYAWRIWSWKYYRTKSIRQLFRLWFVLNDYYEASFPLSALILLLFQEPGIILVALIHLFFFPKTLDHWNWVWKTWVNLELWQELRKYIAIA